MALCSRGHALKATLLVAFLLILLNLLGSRRETTPMSATQWPKRTRPSPDSGGHLQHQQQTANNQTILSHSNNQTATPDLLSLKLLNDTIVGAVVQTKSTLKEGHNESQPDVAAANVTATATGGHNSTSKNSTSLSRTENLVDDSSSADNASSRVSTKHQNDSLDLAQTEVGQEGSCPPIPPSLDGPFEVEHTYEPLTSVEQKLAPKLQPGGQYSPRECRARDRVAHGPGRER